MSLNPGEKFKDPNADFSHTEAVRAKFSPITLPKDKEYEWTKVKTALLISQPFFAHLLMSQLRIVWTKDLPPDVAGATDGFCIFLNPTQYFSFSLGERIFILAHEIMHCVFDHCGQLTNWRRMKRVKFKDGKGLPYDDPSHHQLMNISMDAVINDMLIHGKVGVFKQGWVHMPHYGKKDDEVLEVYRKLWKEATKGGGQGKKGDPVNVGKVTGTGNTPFDQHLEPGAEDGSDPAQAQAKRNDQEWQIAVEQAAAAARAQGSMPAGFDKWVEKLMNPQVEWREHIQALFARKVGSGGYDWRRPDRRLITRDDPVFAPGRSGHGAGVVVVGMDTSGSIYCDPGLIDKFFAELSGILEDVRPRQVFVIWCDAHVHRVDELEEPSDLGWVRAKGAKGGGGTSFVPVFEEIRERHIEPDALVYLTDGQGAFPTKAPSYPVIWGNIEPSSQFPFGDVVQIPITREGN